MDKARIKQIEKEQLVSIDNVIFEPMPKQPVPRDKHIYEYTNAEFEKDFIELDKVITRTCLVVISLCIMGMIYVIR